MRDTPHALVLLEMAAVRLCRMGELLSVGQLAQALSQVGPVTAPTDNGGKKNDPASHGREQTNGAVQRTAGTAVPGEPGLTLTESTRGEVWARLIRYLNEKSPMLAGHVKLAMSSAIFGPNSLAITFGAGYNHAREACATDDNTRRIQDALSRVIGRPAVVRIEELTSDPRPAASSAVVRDRKAEVMRLPLFRKAGEALGAQVWHLDDAFDPAARPPTPADRPGDPDEV
jgi:DNA polymerase-3 subunit gamma/tau